MLRCGRFVLEVSLVLAIAFKHLSGGVSLSDVAQVVLLLTIHLAALLLPLLKDVVDGLRRCISLPQVPTVVRLAQLKVQTGERCMDLLFLGVYSPDCAAYIMQVVVQWIVL